MADPNSSRTEADLGWHTLGLHPSHFKAIVEALSAVFCERLTDTKHEIFRSVAALFAQHFTDPGELQELRATVADMKETTKQLMEEVQRLRKIQEQQEIAFSRSFKPEVANNSNEPVSQSLQLNNPQVNATTPAVLLVPVTPAVLLVPATQVTHYVQVHQYTPTPVQIDQFYTPTLSPYAPNSNQQQW